MYFVYSGRQFRIIGSDIFFGRVRVAGFDPNMSYKPGTLQRACADSLGVKPELVLADNVVYLWPNGRRKW